MMASESRWKDRDEESTPIAPYTKCTAIRDFPGEQAHDLPFHTGDQLTIIEPCKVVFWYLAENDSGRRGVIPINFVKVNTQLSHPAMVSSSSKLAPQSTKESLSSPPPLPPKPKGALPPPPPKLTRVHKSLPRNVVARNVSPVLHKPVGKSTSLQGSEYPGLRVDIDSRPPAPLPPEAIPAKVCHTGSTVPFQQGKYLTQKEFVEKSGWFTRSLETVLCKKMLGSDLLALTNTKFGVYIFIHKNEEHLRYVGKSRNAYQEVVQLFNRLFEKPENKLSPIEMELKYNYPNADSWHFRLYSVSHPELLDCEYTEKIIKHRTLQPEGLNRELKFTSKENFYKFAEFYAKFMREKAAKPNKPVHLLGNASSQR